MKINYQISDIDSVALKVLGALTSRVILIDGSMGVGKTTLIKSLVKSLGSKDVASSPTFSIVNEYELQDGLVYHFDMYRIKDEEEALNFGFEDYIASKHWIVIEWPEKILNLLPEKCDLIELSLNENHSRTLELTKNINLTNKYGKKLQKS